MITNAFLTGEKVYLRPFEQDDLVYIQRWYNDPVIRGLTGITKPCNITQAQEWLNKTNKDEQRIFFAIVLKENNKVIGECGLLRMFPEWRTTDLSIIIGEHDAQGQGYGTEAIRLLLDYAFGYLNFHRVAIGVIDFNEKALRFYEKVGFKREGTQREGYYFNHKYYDFIMMSILEDEYRQSENANPQLNPFEI